MNHPSRRTFVKMTATAGMGFALETELGAFAPLVSEGSVDLAVARDPNPQKALQRAVSAVVGEARLVGRSSRVLVNANTAFRRYGSIARPEVVLEVVRRCFDDGASEVNLVKDVPDRYWDPVADQSWARDLIRSTGRCDRRMREVPLDGGIRLRSVSCLSALSEADHLINVSIAKDHVGVRFSGALKNVMGLTAFRPTNLFCHKGDAPDRPDTDVDHLASCIAELNLLRRPDIHVLDATEFLVTNGPNGPGRLGRADLVIAGRDPVAVDVRAMGVVGRTIDEVPTIGRALGLDLGVANLERLSVMDEAASDSNQT